MVEICTIQVGGVEAAISSQINECTMEIDNHSVMILLGLNCLSVHYFERLVDVYVWDASAVSVELPPISGAVSYYHLISGQVYMLVYHHHIRFTILANHIMCSIKIRMAGFRIN